MIKYKVIKDNNGNSLVVQWLGLGTFTAVGRVQSLVGELRSCKPCSVAKNKIFFKITVCV